MSDQDFLVIGLGASAGAAALLEDPLTGTDTGMVTLPLMPVQPVLPEPEVSRPIDLSAHVIVVVDDNHDVADSLGTLLSMLEAAVHVASTGRDALALIEEPRPSIVFIDLGIPGMERLRLGPGSGKDEVAAAGFELSRD